MNVDYLLDTAADGSFEMTPDYPAYEDNRQVRMNRRTSLMEDAMTISGLDK